MPAENQNSIPPTYPAVGDSGLAPQPTPDHSLAPLDVIRTETVFSRLPVHNLSKKGRVNISIEKKTPDGQVELKWDVSYSEKYGQARQTAYKLDTIIIDAAVEEAGKPLPEKIRLGSLHDICKDLGITEGENKNKIKKAFLQNASTFITAKLKYKANDGTEHSFEAGFTRYTVIFTGQKFTDGTKADAVYIELHPRYREVLNNAPIRPLSLAYKKQLAPGPQRFYEILSFKIYSALRFSLPAAELRYSEYCQASTQQRYFTRAQVQKQMYKIHQPHIESGYILKLGYRETTDEEGNADWLMRYTPGPRAIAEYNQFNPGRKHRTVEAPADQNQIGVGERVRRPRQARLNLRPEQPTPPPVDHKLFSELTSRGVEESVAKRELATLPADHPTLDMLEWFDQEIARPGHTLKNTAAWLVTLIQNRSRPPVTFISSRQSAEQQAAQEAKDQGYIQSQVEADAQAEADRQQLDNTIAQMNGADRLTLRMQAEGLLAHEKDYWYTRSKETGRKETLEQVVSARMRKILKARPQTDLVTEPIAIETNLAPATIETQASEPIQPPAPIAIPESQILASEAIIETAAIEVVETPSDSAIGESQTKTAPDHNPPIPSSQPLQEPAIEQAENIETHLL